jgi:hypothetical protein
VLPLSFGHEEARARLLEQVDAFVSAVGALSDLELLGGSRVHGWSRLEVVTHVRMGLEEVVVGAAPTDAEPDRDAGSYWVSHPDDRDDDPVPHILWLRRVAGAHARPSSAVRMLEAAATGGRTSVGAMAEGAVAFQGTRMTTGDFLATWVVELAIHQLDLDLPGDVRGLDWSRATLEAIAGAALPESLDDHDAVLVGLGRTACPTGVEVDPAFPVSL